MPSAGAFSVASSSPNRLTIGAIGAPAFIGLEELDAALRQEETGGRREQRLLRALGAVLVVLRLARQHPVVAQHVEDRVRELAPDLGERPSARWRSGRRSSTVMPTLPSSAIAAIGLPFGLNDDIMQPQPGPIAVPSSTDSGRSSMNMAWARKECAPPEWIEISMSATLRIH